MIGFGWKHTKEGYFSALLQHKGLRERDFHLRADQAAKNIRSLVGCLPLAALRKVFHKRLVGVSSPVT